MTMMKIKTSEMVAESLADIEAYMARGEESAAAQEAKAYLRLALLDGLSLVIALDRLVTAVNSGKATHLADCGRCYMYPPKAEVTTSDDDNDDAPGYYNDQGGWVIETWPSND